MEVYKKVLVGKVYPDSQCYVEDGHLLTIIPKKILKIRENIEHVFSDLIDPSIKSMYGWVKECEPFTIEDFCSKYSNRKIDEQEKEHIDIMLKSISKLNENTPVKVRYTERGVIEKKMALVVHKVFFYDT
jgi:hypothetical protein